MIHRQISVLDTIHSTLDSTLPNALHCSLPDTLSSTFPIALNCTHPACLTLYSPVRSQVRSQVRSRLHSITHSQPLDCTLPSTLPRSALMCRLSTVLGFRDSLSSRHLAPDGVWRVAGSMWRAAYGGGYGGRNHDVGRFHSLNLIFSALTAIGSHNVSLSWC